MNFFWFFFKWGTVLSIVVALASAPFWYREVFYRVEEELRVRVEATLAKRVPHLEVTIRAAHLLSNGIEVRGLTIAEPGAAGPQSELAYFDSLFLECDTSPHELFSGEPVITRVTATRPVFRRPAPGRHLQPQQGVSTAQAARSAAAADDRRRHDRDLRSAEEPIEHAGAAQFERHC